MQAHQTTKQPQAAGYLHQHGFIEQSHARRKAKRNAGHGLLRRCIAHEGGCRLSGDQGLQCDPAHEEASGANQKGQ